ncbi:hypothetical protein ACJVC5_05225 [Peredibacter sp. HCB2-198]|uniref:hypothetical protein n=1 Tax=Peredibacter sp. HCB2-198 TaxID=3383025 RepID=UPI0038B664D9
MKIFILFVCFISSLSFATTEGQSAYKFLKQKSDESKSEIQFNEYEDIISGSIAFAIGNIGYFTTDSSTLKIAYSGVQTVGIIAVGHGIYDYYYPHFETRLLGLLSKKKLTRGQLSDGYVSLLGEMERAKRLSLLWSSSLLTMQYGLNAFLGKDVPQDLKDIYLFLGGVNAIIAVYSYYNVSDYEQYYLNQKKAKVGLFIVPGQRDTRAGLGISKAW